MRKILLLVLVVCLVGAGGCANKGLTRVTDRLDQCVGKDSSCVKLISFEPRYDYNKAIYLWDFVQANELPDGGMDYFYMLKDEMVINGRSSRFRHEYMKVMINKDDVMTGYERVYGIE